jgi:hypothetical protein
MGSVVRPYVGERAASYGYAMRLAVVQNVLIATEECFAISKRALDEYDGNAKNFADLCIDLHRRGLRNIWTPWARVCVNDSTQRSDCPTADGISSDPYLNPNLTLRDGKPMPAFPPRRDV